MFGGSAMNLTDQKPSVWQRVKSSRYFQFLFLAIAVIVMTIPINLVVFAAARLMRLLTEGVPFMAKSTPGRALNLPSAIVIIAVILIGLAVIGWAYTRLSRWLEQRTPNEYEFVAVLPRLVTGALIGLGLLLASVGTMHLLGDATTVWGTKFVASSNTIAPVIMAPFLEELLFRGILFRLFEEMYGTLVALLVSSAFFGFAHFANPNSGFLPALFIAIEAGVLLGTAYVATRSLWLPMGLHFGWNFTESDLLGTPDSGTIVHGIFYTTTHGNALITGGAFGPEASIITPAFCLVAAYLLYRTAQQRGYWQPLRRQHFGPVAV